MRLLLLLTLVVSGAAALAPPAHAKGGVYDGRFVRVDGDVDARWLAVAGDLGDALFRQLAHDFDRAPEKSELPLRLTLFPDRATFEKAVLPLRLRAKQIGGHGVAGGWTRWSPCASFVWLQADAFHTRRLVLHELVHQFYALCRDPSRRGHGAFWYREGLAEYYGWHRRTPKGLQFGAFDVMARGTRMHDLKRAVHAGAWSAFAVGAGVQTASYNDATALVGALRATSDKALRERFRRFEQEVLERGGGGKTFGRLFGEHRDELDVAVKAWWKRYTLPWLAFGRGWDEKNGVLEASPEGVAVASPLGSPPLWQRVTMRVDFPSRGGGSAGFLLADGRGKRPDLLFEIRRGLLTVSRVRGAARAAIQGGAVAKEGGETLKSLEVPSQSAYRLRLIRGARTFVLSVETEEGERRLTLPADTPYRVRALKLGSLSLVVRGGRAVLRSVAFGAPEPPK